jgi:hypothetical protein
MPALAAATSCVFSVFDNFFNLLTWVSFTIPERPRAQSLMPAAVWEQEVRTRRWHREVASLEAGSRMRSAIMAPTMNGIRSRRTSSKLTQPTAKSLWSRSRGRGSRTLSRPSRPFLLVDGQRIGTRLPQVSWRHRGSPKPRSAEGICGRTGFLSRDRFARRRSPRGVHTA